MRTGSHRRFADRRDAGRQLAQALDELSLLDPVVLALPRGGVPVAFEVARTLRAPLDLLLVRKIRAPGNPEYGIGAIIDGDHPQVVLNDDAMRFTRRSSRYVDAETQRQLELIERRRAIYLGDRPPVRTEGRTVLASIREREHLDGIDAARDRRDQARTRPASGGWRGADHRTADPEFVTQLIRGLD